MVTNRVRSGSVVGHPFFMCVNGLFLVNLKCQVGCCAAPGFYVRVPLKGKNLSIHATTQCSVSELSTIVSNVVSWSSDIFRAIVSFRAHTHDMF